MNQSNYRVKSKIDAYYEHVEERFIAGQWISFARSALLHRSALLDSPSYFKFLYFIDTSLGLQSSFTRVPILLEIRFRMSKCIERVASAAVLSSQQGRLHIVSYISDAFVALQFSRRFKTAQPIFSRTFLT